MLIDQTILFFQKPIQLGLAKNKIRFLEGFSEEQLSLFANFKFLCVGQRNEVVFEVTYKREVIINPELALTPKEESLMDLLVSHFVDFYFENPQRFLEPVLGKLS